MSFYTDLRKTADTLLQGKGAPMTLTRSVAGAYNPATGSAALVLTDYTVTAAWFEMQRGDGDIKGSNIVTGDKRVLISAQGLVAGAVPNTNDYLLIEGVKHSIIEIKVIAPAGVPVLYIAHCRKGG